MNNSVTFVLNPNALVPCLEAMTKAASAWASQAPAARLVSEVERFGSTQMLANFINIQITQQGGGWRKAISSNQRMSLEITQGDKCRLLVKLLGPDVASYRSTFVESVVQSIWDYIQNKDSFPRVVTV